MNFGPDRRANLCTKPLRQRKMRGAKRWDGSTKASERGYGGRLRFELRVGGGPSGHRLASDTRSTRVIHVYTGFLLWCTPDVHRRLLSALFMLFATFRIYNLLTMLDGTPQTVHLSSLCTSHHPCMCGPTECVAYFLLDRAIAIALRCDPQ
jgi:hypothetical protein